MPDVVYWCAECEAYVSLPVSRKRDKLGARTDATAGYNEHEFAHVSERLDSEYPRHPW
jgi:hypothetical protein